MEWQWGANDIAEEVTETWHGLVAVRGAMPHGHGFYYRKFGNFELRKYRPDTVAAFSPGLVCRPLAAASRTHCTTYSAHWERAPILLGCTNEDSYTNLHHVCHWWGPRRKMGGVFLFSSITQFVPVLFLWEKKIQSRKGKELSTGSTAQRNHRGHGMSSQQFGHGLLLRCKRNWQTATQVPTGSLLHYPWRRIWWTFREQQLRPIFEKNNVPTLWISNSAWRKGKK